VEFQSLTDPALIVRGTIKPDGTFTLTTRNQAGKEAPGAVEGQYRVTVHPAMTENQSIEPIQVSELFTVKAQDDNRFTITVTGSRR
jgi:hypothetical protein